jgi:hypothetical protein
MGDTWNKKETKKGRWVTRLRGPLKKCGRTMGQDDMVVGTFVS